LFKRKLQIGLLILFLRGQSSQRGTVLNYANTMTSSARDVCTELLPNLEEDIFEYIVGVLEEFESGPKDDDDKEENASMISNFLMSAEYIEDEDEALVKAKELLSRVCSSGNDTATTSSNVPQKLSEETRKMTLKLDDTLVIDDANTKVNKNTLIGQEPVAAAEKSVKQAKKQEKKSKFAKPSAFEQSEQQALELEAELTQARIAAVKARSKMGAYKGALDAKAFTLANPGGGQPLLEDAACRLVWGRRYGLIGRNGMVRLLLFMFKKLYPIIMLERCNNPLTQP